MCTTCGCSDGETRIDGVTLTGGAHAHEHAPERDAAPTRWRKRAGGADHAPVPAQVHQHPDGTWHSHVHGGGSSHEALAGAPALGAAHEDGTPAARIVRIEQDILARNDAFAAQNRQAFADRGIFALNLVSSPGSGKTTLLVRTIEALQGRTPVSVIEGDQQTSLDADRIRATGARGGADQHRQGLPPRRAHGRARRCAQLDPADGGLLLIENVGNLVCPAAFDLGEAHKVVILSVTEGEDKPLKYPDMFHAADLMLREQGRPPALRAVRRRRSRRLRAARTSGTRSDLPVGDHGEGFAAWLAWLERGVVSARAARDEDLAALRRRVAELEAKLASAADCGLTNDPPGATMTSVTPA